ncbi:hypothetical protein [Gillisia sp. CAL575]|nr:hypothetical protein [Gillisia sp. CAL575]
MIKSLNELKSLLIITLLMLVFMGCSMDDDTTLYIPIRVKI